MIGKASERSRGCFLALEDHDVHPASVFLAQQLPTPKTRLLAKELRLRPVGLRQKVIVADYDELLKR